jgi:hypothetical protein
MPTVRLLVWSVGVLAARSAAAHHPDGTEGGGSWIWLFLGIVCLLAGVAAWAFLGGEEEDGGDPEQERASER